MFELKSFFNIPQGLISNVYLITGIAGDSVTQHHGYPFTTKDQDNESYDGNCAKELKEPCDTWPVIAQTSTITIIVGSAHRMLMESTGITGKVTITLRGELS